MELKDLMLMISQLALKLDAEMRPLKLNFGLICLKSELQVAVNLSEA